MLCNGHIMSDKNFYVYILTNKRYGTLYIGVTSDLPKRIYQHKNRLMEGFSKKHGLDQLVYYESQGNAEAAITREKNMKEWKRAWKIELIEKSNPNWFDLTENMLGG